MGLPDYTRFSDSIALFKYAETLIPGGVNSPVRAFRHVGGSPIFIEKGNGSTIIDVDGNTYVDYCQSWGPLILGHAHPVIVESIRRAAGSGLSFGTCHKKEIQVAEMILNAMPEFDNVRLVNSGTEAVMTSLRIARGFTKRDYIVKFNGGYHGHSDSLLVKAGSGLITQGLADSAGIPEGIAKLTLVAQLDNEQSVEELFSKMGDRIAAVIIEPIPANNGLLIQRKEFLLFLRKITDKYGSMLIFDEVISGFRLHYGGYYKTLNIIPDLITLGKIVGGGLPVGAIVGSRKIMQTLAPLGEVYQAGTLSGNPLALTAGIETLKILSTGEPYLYLDLLGKTFASILDASKIPFAKVQRVGSLVWFYCHEGAFPRKPDEISQNAVNRYKTIYWEFLSNGFYLPPSAYEVMFFSTAHTIEDIKLFGQEAVRLLSTL